MIATVYSTLSGKLAGKHPTLGVLVREDGMILMPKGWTRGCSLRKDGKYRYVRIDGKWKGVHRLVAQTFLPNLKTNLQSIILTEIQTIIAYRIFGGQLTANSGITLHKY